MESFKLILEGLSDLDEEELREAIGADRVEFTRGSAPKGALPEPATIEAMITLTPLVLAALTAYLAKKRRRRVIRTRQRIVHPDGTIEEREFDLDESSEAALKSGILQQLTNWIGVSSQTEAS